VQYSPDGKRVTFLKARADEAARFDLWQFDVATGEQSMLVDSKLLEPEEVELSEEEKALRERKRIAGRKGIVSYDWGTRDTILVPIGGDLWLVTLGDKNAAGFTLKIDPERAAAEGLSVAEIQRQVDTVHEGFPGAQVDPADLQNMLLAREDKSILRLSEVATLEPAPRGLSVRQLTDTDAFEYDAKVSPGGKFVSFVRDGAVYAIDLASGEESRLTPLAEPENAVAYGVAEFVAQEEMSRYTGYWWSPGSRYLAYTKVDESTVDIIPRFDIRAEDVAVIEQRYPRAGRPNAIVDLFVRDMETGEVVEVDWRREDWGPATDQYLARVNWTDLKDDKLLVVQRVDRDQTQIEHPAWVINGEIVTPFDGGPYGEIQKYWVNLSYDLTLKFPNMVTTSERTGHRHIVHFNLGHGDLIHSVTSGEWDVDTIVHADPFLEDFYFTGYKDTPLERHLYRYGAGDEAESYEPTRITELGKSWSIAMAPDGQSFVGTSSSPTQPSQTGLYKADGSLITWIEENALNEDHPYAPYLAEHTVPEYGTLTAEDGQTLYYSIQLPPNFDPSKKYPALVEVYGGPGVQTVTRNWERLSDQFYSREGYVVFRLDNRGSSNRGKKFEDVIYRQTGGPEVRDQLLGVAWLKSQPFVDADRVGIQGWSYGGYMTLMTILQAPEGTFAAAVAGAPVTDWTLYDTFYTERYMDTPQDNPDGYEKSSVFYHLDRLEGELTPLLLIHGMADDNVTFDNTTRLMAELQEQGRHFELMTYPGQRHGIRGEALQVHLMRTRMAFLERKLKSEE
jgi:dipeptidyl-peptidase-4